MDNCPKCQSKLNIDEKCSGRCFSCGATFESPLPKDNRNFNYQATDTTNTINTINTINTTDNTVAKAIKICGIIIIILGTILSFIIAGGNGRKYEFSLLQFLAPEAISIISGLVFIGFSEIIQLLEDIKNKLK